MTVGGHRTAFPDAASFLAAYEEIFADRIYAFRANTDAPTILDLGANVGLAVIFFKQLYPAARIIALEPDPSVFSYLRRNVAAHGFADVELHNAAIWTEAASLAFNPDGADGGRLVPEGPGGPAAHDAQSFRVRTMGIGDLCQDRRIDFLKMDIEGAEHEVLPAAEPHLVQVDNIFVEYHSTRDTPQHLDAVVGTLARAGFRLDITPGSSVPSPILRKRLRGRFDLQLNITGSRR